MALIDPSQLKLLLKKNRSERAVFRVRWSPQGFCTVCVSVGLGRPITEYRFTTGRRWRFDFAWVDKMVALEIEGGVWKQGRHTRGKGFIDDMEKYNEAAILGWKILRCEPRDVQTGAILKTLRRALLT